MTGSGLARRRPEQDTGRAENGQGGKVKDSVAVDAKRILLRYGTPISVLDRISEEERIGLARTIAKTTLPEREQRLRDLLAEAGHLTVA